MRHRGARPCLPHRTSPASCCVGREDLVLEQQGEAASSAQQAWGQHSCAAGGTLVSACIWRELCLLFCTHLYQKQPQQIRRKGESFPESTSGLLQEHTMLTEEDGIKCLAWSLIFPGLEARSYLQPITHFIDCSALNLKLQRSKGPATGSSWKLITAYQGSQRRSDTMPHA